MDDLTKGRAEVIDEVHTLRIVIPGKKHPIAIFMSIFFGVFLIGGWSTDLVTVIRHILESISKGDTTNLTFILTWLIGWTIGGIFFLIIILWIWARKETITLSQNILRLERKVLGIGKSRRYSLSDIKNFRLNTSAETRNAWWGLGSWSGGLDFWGMGAGTLAFDYGMRTIRFAYEIDEPEANYLLDLLRQRGIDINPSSEVERRLKESEETGISHQDRGVEKRVMSRFIIVLIIVVIAATMLWQFWPEKASTPTTSAPSTNLMFEDRFDNPGSGWPTRYDEIAELKYEEGEYHILVKEARRVPYALNSDAGPFTNFTLEIDARLVSGPEQTDYGMVFRRQDSDNFYFFTVSANGNYAVGKKVKGEWYPLETGKSAFINEGNGINSLKVICDGSEIQAFVNENHITTIKDNSFNEGHIGMMVGVRDQPYAHVAFDSLKVSK